MSIKTVLKTRAIGICRVPGLLGFLAAAALVLHSSITKATDRYWNVSSGDWSTASNWLPLPGTEPNSSSNAYIQNGGTATISQTGETCNSLYIGSTGPGTVEMTNGVFHVESAAYVGLSDTGTFNQSGGDYSPDTEEGLLYLGYNATGNGTYFLSGSGQLSGMYHTTECIGYYGTGTFNQSGGTNGQWGVDLGDKTGSNGTYNLTGGTLSVGWGSIFKGSGTAAFNFGGGTIRAGYIFTTSLPMTLTGNGGDANIDTNNYTATFSGNLSGPGGLNKIGGGTLTLSGTNTYYGDTKINFGVIDLGNSNALSNSTLDYSYSAGTVTFGTLSSAILGGIKGSKNLSLVNSNLSAIELQIGNNGQSTIYSGAFSGIGSITKIGTGILTLSHANTFSGATNFNGGLINAAALNNLGNGTALNFNGGGLQCNGVYDPSVRTMTFQAGGATLDTQTYNIILAHAIGNNGAGGLTKEGSGKLTLNALNTYSGNTTINGGTLEIAGGIPASGTSLIDVQSGTVTFKTTPINKSNLNINTAALATFELVNGAHTVGAISGNGITKIDANASLTAASISQGTITLASGATLTIAAIPGGPQGGVITPVPEPAGFVLLAAAFIMALFRRAKKSMR